MNVKFEIGIRQEKKMSKRKYEKPIVNDFDSISLAHGSCVSGTGELTLAGCNPGGTAAICSTGSGVLGDDVCRAGGNAAWSCKAGSYAG